jgi:acyl carrier protein
LDPFLQIKEILINLLDIEDHEITPETYLIRDLGAESIDLLELAVAISAECGVQVNDNDIFLKPLRLYLGQAKENGIDPGDYLTDKFPFLTGPRIREILADIHLGPVLKVKDLTGYVAWKVS